MRAIAVQDALGVAVAKLLVMLTAIERPLWQK